MKKTRNPSLWIGSELEHLDQLAERRGITRSALVRELIAGQARRELWTDGWPEEITGHEAVVLSTFTHTLSQTGLRLIPRLRGPEYHMHGPMRWVRMGGEDGDSAGA